MTKKEIVNTRALVEQCHGEIGGLKPKLEEKANKALTRSRRLSACGVNPTFPSILHTSLCWWLSSSKWMRAMP